MCEPMRATLRPRLRMTLAATRFARAHAAEAQSQPSGICPDRVIKGYETVCE